MTSRALLAFALPASLPQHILATRCESDSGVKQRILSFITLAPAAPAVAAGRCTRRRRALTAGSSSPAGRSCVGAALMRRGCRAWCRRGTFRTNVFSLLTLPLLRFSSSSRRPTKVFIFVWLSLRDSANGVEIRSMLYQLLLQLLHPRLTLTRLTVFLHAQQSGMSGGNILPRAKLF